VYSDYAYKLRSGFLTILRIQDCVDGRRDFLTFSVYSDYL